MADLLNNLGQAARDSYEDLLKKLADNLSSDAGGTNFTAANNFTVKGALTVSGLTSGTNQAYTSIASIGAANIYSNASAVNALVVGNSSAIISAPTYAPLQLIASAPSQSFFNFVGAIGSTASLNLAANKVAAFVQVTFAGGPAGQGIGYLPIFTGVI